jgi:tRNA(fMet)-specific endonuclease VapC
MAQGMILVDTSVIIEYFRSKDRVNSLLHRLTYTDFMLGISSITEFEIRRGIKIMNADFTEKLLENFKILPFDSTCAKKASTIYINLRAKNKLIDFPDLTIGATALAHEIPLATHNISHFNRIEDLVIYKNIDAL